MLLLTLVSALVQMICIIPLHHDAQSAIAEFVDVETW